MRTISAPKAGRSFFRLLSDVVAGQRVVITQRGRPVAVLAPYGYVRDDKVHEAAVERVCHLMRKGVRLGGTRFTRDEMHDR